MNTPFYFGYVFIPTVHTCRHTRKTALAIAKPHVHVAQSLLDLVETCRGDTNS